MADAADLKSASIKWSGGSSPFLGTKQEAGGRCGRQRLGGV